MTIESDDTITWYRSILANRARSVEGCPLGKLFTRKSTTKSSSASKYARDCYILQQFISGDNSSIDEVFRKDDTKSVSEPTGTSNCHIIEMRVTLQTAITRLNELERVEKENTKTISELRTENEKLREDLSDINDRLQCK